MTIRPPFSDSCLAASASLYRLSTYHRGYCYPPIPSCRRGTRLGKAVQLGIVWRVEVEHKVGEDLVLVVCVYVLSLTHGLILSVSVALDITSLTVSGGLLGSKMRMSGWCCDDSGSGRVGSRLRLNCTCQQADCCNNSPLRERAVPWRSHRHTPPPHSPSGGDRRPCRPRRPRHPRRYPSG